MKPNIMFVSGAPSSRAEVRGLFETAGFRVTEIDAERLKGLLGRPLEPARAPLRASGLRVDVAARLVTRAGKALSLTKKEFELLSVLVERRGRVLERDFLLDTVWGCERDRDAHTLEVHVSSLRRKLGAPLARRIVTVPGLGYRFEKEA